ncbi:MAG TPA: cytochrome c [Pseudolabrys sp.]|nr:cytochrome c [Pseudolabrys sp.]
MCTHKIILAAATAMIAFTQAASAQAVRYGFGSPATPEELSKFFAIPPDGHDLPPGSGDATKGKEIYDGACAACHGDKLQGNPAKGIGGDKLIGGRGSLATKAPVKTVESYWPHATTLFDYVKRAMPFNAPGSLSDDDVYSVVAYILSEAKIIQPTEVMDAKSLPKVVMPNRDGFESDPRPELELYR